MIELSHKGANHGWSVMEGTHDFQPGRKRGPTPIVPPIVEHHHTDCRSITGGYVYQGSKFKELHGLPILYGDYQYGKVWGLRYNHRAKKVTSHKELAKSTVKISSFGVGRDGSFYAARLRCRPYRATGESSSPPQDARHSHGNSVRPDYSHQCAITRSLPVSCLTRSMRPFWSDGAQKEAILCLTRRKQNRLQGTERAGNGMTGCDGKVVLTGFRSGKSGIEEIIETRIVLKQDDQWRGLHVSLE